MIDQRSAPKLSGFGGDGFGQGAHAEDDSGGESPGFCDRWPTARLPGLCLLGGFALAPQPFDRSGLLSAGESGVLALDLLLGVF
ncbi:hypothetical protein ACWD4F_27880 [Streptomyces aureus]